MTKTVPITQGYIDRLIKLKDECIESMRISGLESPVFLGYLAHLFGYIESLEKLKTEEEK